MTIQEIKERLAQEHPNQYGNIDEGDSFTVQDIIDRLKLEQPDPFGYDDSEGTITIQQIKDRVALEHPSAYGYDDSGDDITVQDIIDRVADEHPHQYESDVLIQWVNDVEHGVSMFLRQYDPSAYPESEEEHTALNETLILHEPDLYVQYVVARICLANEEYDRYNAHASIYNSRMEEWKTRHAQYRRTDEAIIQWMNDVDTEVAMYMKQYGEATDFEEHDALTDIVLLNDMDLYVQYVLAKICLANNEGDSYKVHIESYNSQLEEWRSRYSQFKRSDEVLIKWVNDVDREAYLFKSSYEGGTQGGYHDHTALTDTVLLKEMDIYIQYLLWQLCVSGRDFDKADIHLEQYNTKLEAWKNRYKWFRKDDMLIAWINDVERDISMFLRTFEGIITESSEKHTALTDEVMMEEPDLYVQYIICRIFLANEEYEQSSAHAEVYRARIKDWKERYLRAHEPLSERKFRI